MLVPLLPATAPRLGSLGLLVNRVAVFRVEEILQMLCQNLISGKREQQRDIAGIGLKTVIAGIKGGPLAAVVVKQVSPMMVQGVQKKVRCMHGNCWKDRSKAGSGGGGGGVSLLMR